MRMLLIGTTSSTSHLVHRGTSRFRISPTLRQEGVAREDQLHPEVPTAVSSRIPRPASRIATINTLASGSCSTRLGRALSTSNSLFPRLRIRSNEHEFVD